MRLPGTKKVLMVQFYSEAVGGWVDIKAAKSLREAGFVLRDYHQQYPRSMPLRVRVTTEAIIPVEFHQCARPDCRREYFRSSKHYRTFCSYGCASVDSMRRKRKERAGV